MTQLNEFHVYGVVIFKQAWNKLSLWAWLSLRLEQFFRHDDQINFCLLLNEEILEPIRVSRNISVVYNPFLSVRIAPVYAFILKPLTAGDDLRIQYSSN